MKKIYLLTLLSLTAVTSHTLAQPSPSRTGDGPTTATQPRLLSYAPRPGTELPTRAVEVTVSGKVVDEKRAELPGVTVAIKGASQGTTTDGTGSFRITVPDPSAVLVFSFVGYVRQEIVVGNQTALTVALLPDNQTLNEVVVVGYGSQRRQDITSAVSVINMRDLGEQPANNPNQILQGRAPGVVVKQTSGTPGGEFQVRVRGIGSLGAGSDPLYVIDGFVVGTSVGQNLNPNDIESVSVLKDAASTAIYGARGSNGVVLITTKQAKDGKVNINLSLDYGIQSLPRSRRISMMNGIEFAQFKKEIFMDQIRIIQKRKPTEAEVPAGIRFPEQTKYSTNWFDLIMRDNAPYSDANLTISSGTGPIKALMSAGYYKEDGVVKNTNYDRFSLRTNLGGQVNKFINFGLNINGTYTRQKLAAVNGRGGVVGSSLVIDPRQTAYNPDGSLVPYINGVDGVFGFPNPLYVLENVDRRRNISDVLTNGFIELSFLKSFKFKTSANIKLNNNTTKTYVPSTIGLAVASGSSGAPPRNASETDQTEELINYSVDQLLTFKPQLPVDHTFDALVGYTAQQERVRGIIGTGNTFPDDLVPYLGSASIRSANSYEFGFSLLAFLGRVNYSYKDKYLFSATYRREGSSRFGANSKYGDFPAASIGWRLTEESFIPKTAWLSDLKLRASWGVTGNNDIGNYPSLAFVGANNYILGNTFVPGKNVSSFANQELRWEKSNQVDIGMDLALFNSKLVFNVEYYNKITNDMLLPVSIPSVSGFTSSLANIGKVSNHGVEVGADYRTNIGQFNLRTNANISFNRNKILAIQGANDALYYGEFYSGYSVQKVGRPIGMIYGYEKIGIFNTQAEIDAAPKQDGAIPGAMKFADTNGDGIISYDTKDMVEIGNPNPSFNWAWTLAGDYKQFDFNILFLGAQNFDIYRNIESSTMNMDGVFNVQTKAKDRWRSAENPGPNPSDVHSQGGTSYFKWSRESSNRYVYDASYTWLKTVTIGYNLPKFKSVLSSARIFVTANNLFLFSKYPGSNPDVSSRSTTEPNIDDEAYPVPRTIATGIKLNF
ncbi:SusC/RagA family TonB-linked outer membrane protein [Spirosoma utsteinense]|uniref:TonB-linked SusC/RagA family outer membrane protein n=1 Tax=Spirosoma utsteinense TaxID=2585773 RepID=A0ABR6WEJ8_9BACT|nr:TonB-dependent receptor [Spirosoma utsteinense]MBC3788685.1 TonB-linked SusC/RagA family outer membrane protein [Spirosoma utsteinense]MBC3794623.1 TonB-linked SusC/RagA family outer membrane protein [Spirosoma utsteinense]